MPQPVADPANGGLAEEASTTTLCRLTRRFGLGFWLRTTVASLLTRAFGDGF